MDASPATAAAPSEAADPYLLARHQGRRPVAPRWFDDALAQAPERTHFLSQGARIELLRWGQVGRPALLFLPGNGAHADWWSPIAPFFAEHFHCAALSWSGMGRSDRRPEGYSVATLAQEARDAIETADLHRGGPVILVGHSLGGLLGLHAAADGLHIGGLILIDSPIAMPRERSRALHAAAPKSRSAHRPFASVAEGLARFRLSPPQACGNDYFVDHVARLSLVAQDDAWVWRFDPRRISFTQPGGPLLKGVTCPLAFLYGDRSALIDSDTLAHTVAALPPGTPVVPILDAAHHVPLDQPLALVVVLRVLLADWPRPGQDWQGRPSTGPGDT
jgi:pimeloyl-ACP methyl ester carboxylesterase